MYRAISFIVIFSFVSVMLYFHNLNSHHNQASGHATHSMSSIIVPEEGPVPSIKGSIKQDPTGSWLLKVETKNFIFTPEKVGQDSDRFNEGHAHIYLNGKKINRLYGEYYNLDITEPGTYEVKVSLNGNNHVGLIYKGQEIAFRQTIRVDKK